jgi:hypothetical protein
MAWIRVDGCRRRRFVPAKQLTNIFRHAPRQRPPSFASLVESTYAMQSRITDHRFDTALPACAAHVYPHLTALPALLRKRAFRRCLRTTLLATTMAAALSGCGVFCGGAGGSGGGFAGGCATGVRF